MSRTEQIIEVVFFSCLVVASILGVITFSLLCSFALAVVADIIAVVVGVVLVTEKISDFQKNNA